MSERSTEVPAVIPLPEVHLCPVRQFIRLAV